MQLRQKYLRLSREWPIDQACAGDSGGASGREAMGASWSSSGMRTLRQKMVAQSLATAEGPAPQRPDPKGFADMVRIIAQIILCVAS
jgi:hypothetical protein